MLIQARPENDACDRVRSGSVTNCAIDIIRAAAAPAPIEIHARP
ncbi:MAG TPA: hypothetical protein VGT07_12555 [Steroidobacteraceae bacterium]|nr:hypothetical protein [Steroidobacteraceae bacterium]